MSQYLRFYLKNADRDIEISKLVLSGWSRRLVADKYGITVKRVGEIFTRGKSSTPLRG